MICLIMYVMIAYHTQTDIKVNTEDTLSRFQELLIQLIIKHRSNKRKTIGKKICQNGLEPSTYTVEHLERNTR